MTQRGPRYSKDQFARKAEEIFERDIQPNLSGHGDEEFVLIDIETGDYEIGADELAASDRLQARRADAQIWVRRVGSPFARRFGGRLHATRA